MKSLLDPSFEYTPSYEADIQHIFARVRRELAEREGADADADFSVDPTRASASARVATGATSRFAFRDPRAR